MSTTNNRRIRLTLSASQAFKGYERLACACLKNGDLNSSAVAIFRSILEFAEQAKEENPFSAERALAGPLCKCYVAVVGPLRIYYTEGAENQDVVIFHFWEKVSGPDASEIVSKMVGSEKFDSIFRELGLSTPDRSATRSPHLQ